MTVVLSGLLRVAAEYWVIMYFFLYGKRRIEVIPFVSPLFTFIALHVFTGPQCIW
jgi:hypothetical protein